MKKYFTVFIIISVFFGCDKEESLTPETEITGIWRLVEVLADPGDGSGTFQPATIDKTLTFTADGTVSTNSGLCPFSLKTDNSGTGTYTFKDDMGTIVPTHCPDFALRIEISENKLILHLPCVEPCAAKYEKMNLRD